jgi:hypothetical protein
MNTVNASYFTTNIINNIIDYSNNTFTGVSIWQGIRKLNGPNKYIISGTTFPNPALGVAVLYIGDIQCSNTNNVYTISVPNSLYTSGYGPNYISNFYYLVGSYTPISNYYNLGFLFKTSNLNTSSSYPSNYFYYPDVNSNYQYVYCHSICKNLMVGNCINLEEGNALQKIKSMKAFIYNTNVSSSNILTSKKFINFPKARFTNVYGIIHDINDIYIIAGGYGNKSYNLPQIYNDGLPKPFFKGYIASFNNKTQKIFNITSISTNNKNEVVHVQGITKLSQNEYGLSVDVISLRNINLTKGYFVKVKKIGNKKGFTILNWFPLKSTNDSFMTANSVAGYNVVGKNIIKNDKYAVQCHLSIKDTNNVKNISYFKTVSFF